MTFRMYKQGPTVKHKELYPISWDKSEKKENILKIIYRLRIGQSFCHIAEIGTTLYINCTSVKKKMWIWGVVWSSKQQTGLKDKWYLKRRKYSILFLVFNNLMNETILYVYEDTEDE